MDKMASLGFLFESGGVLCLRRGEEVLLRLRKEKWGVSHGSGLGRRGAYEAGVNDHGAPVTT